MRLVFERSFIILLATVSSTIFRAKVYMPPILSGPFAEAGAALQRFLDKGAASYEARRNFDYGPTNRNNVSELSKFISHRVLFEYDVAKRALAQHPPKVVDKFIQEVFWRIYWKGWLEHRPTVWNDYVAFDHDSIP